MEQERIAAEKLRPEAYGYYATGSGDEISLAEAGAAWQRIRFRPRVLRDVSTVDTGVTLFDSDLATPILAAPTAYHAGAHPDGECATVRGVGDAGSLMVLSSRCSRRIEDVAAAATGPWWFQVYVLNDPDATAGMVRRAVAAGAGALVLTVDTPYPGNKKRSNAEPPATEEEFLVNLAEHLAPGADPYVAVSQSAACTVDTLRELTGYGVPVLVKGVLRGDDAADCVVAGAAGVIVSNHGGRQLDQAIATADALGEVVAAVGGRVPVLVDGGVRTGRDVLAALALGASAVLLGRPILWALAADGAAGVTAALTAVREELVEALALAGVAAASAVTADLVAPRTLG